MGRGITPSEKSTRSKRSCWGEGAHRGVYEHLLPATWMGLSACEVNAKTYGKGGEGAQLHGREKVLNGDSAGCKCREQVPCQTVWHGSCHAAATPPPSKETSHARLRSRQAPPHPQAPRPPGGVPPSTDLARGRTGGYNQRRAVRAFHGGNAVAALKEERSLRHGRLEGDLHGGNAVAALEPVC
jgi:hypothetical protein